MRRQAGINALNALRNKIRDLATARLGKNAGMVVGVVRRGETWAAGFGALDAERQPPDEDTIFEIGSITKVITTLLLAEMVKRGEVALDEPVQKYLPGNVQAPKWRDQEITLFHLATHTSSLPRLPTNFWNTVKDRDNPYANYQASDLYEFLSGYRLKRPIGSRVEYSNLGMGLLGHVLGLAAGKSYEELASERVLRPLGMNDTSIALRPEQQGRLAPGHAANGKLAAPWDIPALAGCGAMRSTARDLLRFAAASMNAEASPLADAVELCQRLRPKACIARRSWKAYAFALLFSGLSIGAQWQFKLAPGDPSFVLAIWEPIILVAAYCGLAPGLLTTGACVAGAHFLQGGHKFVWWSNLLLGAAVSFFASRYLRSRDRELMLGWQHQQLYRFNRGPRFVWHNGRVGGYASFLGFIREKEVAVVVLANSAKSVDAVGVNVLKLLDQEA